MVDCYWLLVRICCWFSGVGRTRFTLRASWFHLDPVAVVVREDLTFDYLILHYVFDDGIVREVLGDLAKAIVSSWISIELEP